MRVVRLVLGSLLVLVSLPTLLVGAGLWIAMQPRGPGGGFAAALSPVAVGRPGPASRARGDERRRVHRRAGGADRGRPAPVAEPDDLGTADPRDRHRARGRRRARLAPAPAGDRVRGGAQPGPGDRRAA